jgi:Cys-Gly metallodipeptidase DUG1
VLEAHQALGTPLPVNLRFCFEGMEESGSEGLDDFINAEAQRPGGWFAGVDCVCIVSAAAACRARGPLTRARRATTTG